MEYLTQWEPDTEKVICGEKNIPVKVLFRGPLTKRSGNPVKHLEGLFAEMGIPVKNDLENNLERELDERKPEKGKQDCMNQKSEIDEQRLDILPPAAPDFSGVMDFLSGIDCNAVLISPGGCKSCIEHVDGQIGNVQDNCQYGTRFTDLSVTGGCEEALVDVIDGMFCDSKPVFLTGSAVMQTIGFDDEYLIEQLSARGKKSLFFKSSGFEGCPEAVDSAMMKVGKLYFQNPGKCQKNLVLITGYTSLATGGKETLQPVIDRLKKNSMEVLYLGEKWRTEKNPLPAVIWMVSAEGISVTKWMQEEYGIPCVIGRNLEKTYADELADEIIAYAEMPDTGSAYRDGSDTEIACKDRSDAAIACKDRPEKGTLHKDWGEINKISFPENTAMLNKKAESSKKTVWILGEPVLTISLYRFCNLYYKEMEYRTAVYIPTSGMKRVYGKLSDDWIYLHSQEEMAEIICEGTVIADEFIIRFLRNRHPDIKGITVRFPEISGNRSTKCGKCKEDIQNHYS